MTVLEHLEAVLEHLEAVLEHLEVPGGTLRTLYTWRYPEDPLYLVVPWVPGSTLTTGAW